MKLLNKNCYEIRFSNRCNYNCSYCSNKENRKLENTSKSFIENNTQQLITFLNNLTPGNVLVSGGEPLLWRDFNEIMNNTNHNYIVLTNLYTTKVNWMYNNKLKLIIPTLHEGVSKNKFIDSLKDLCDRDILTHTKLIVSPNKEYEKLSIWREINEFSVASFIPEEFNKQNLISEDFKKDLIENYLTSLQYNYRFFRVPNPININCIAGTKDMIAIQQDGSITRCGKWWGDSSIGNINNYKFYESGVFCNATDCFCDWHDWSDIYPNDNDRWDYYIKNKKWLRPNKESFRKYIEVRNNVQ